MYAYQIVIYHISFQVSLTQARIDTSELDEDSDGFLQPQVLTLHFWLLLDIEGVFGSDSKMSRNTFKRLKAIFLEFGIKI